MFYCLLFDGLLQNIDELCGFVAFLRRNILHGHWAHGASSIVSISDVTGVKTDVIS